MKKLMFYCQHILGIGHLVRSMEIVRGLTSEFQICFVNGGEVVPGFEVPQGVEIVNLPAIKTDPGFQTLQSVDDQRTLEDVQAMRKQTLLTLFDLFRPDVLVIELFPFGRRRFSFELIPLLDFAQATASTRVVCSLRDIVVTKQDQGRHEEKVCRLINRYFDQVLIHGDPYFQPLETSFSRVADLECEVHYTGYVSQALPTTTAAVKVAQPLILTSVGGGRFGHDLLECVVQSAPLLAERIPHHIQIFGGPFLPESVMDRLQTLATGLPNLTLERYTPHLLEYMQKADLSISMSGYNTTMNVLSTGVRSLMMAFTGNQDQEQMLRSQKLAEQGIIGLIEPADLEPTHFAAKVVASLEQKPTLCRFDMDGVAKTAICIKQLLKSSELKSAA